MQSSILVSHDLSEIILICWYSDFYFNYYQLWKSLCCFIYLQHLYL